MAVKPFRASVAASTSTQAWAPTNSSYVIELTGGLLGIEIGTYTGQAVMMLMNGTAAAAGTLAYIPLGGSAAAGDRVAVPLDFGKQPLQVDGAGGLAARFINAAVAAATVSGYFTGREQRRT